jgi:hypothetical protein
MVKEQIMLNGGVITSLAMSRTTFDAFVLYRVPGDGVFSTYEDAEQVAVNDITMHAVFCYGWRDDPVKVDEGYWLCKNR